jgi:hypothetical protein
MSELILLLALVPQVRFGVAAVSLGAVITSVLATLAWRDAPWPLWPANLLALTLLATDPATIPRSPAGRLVYGALVGGLFWATREALLAGGQSDFFAKVFPITLANALVPAIVSLLQAPGVAASKPVRFVDRQQPAPVTIVWFVLAATLHSSLSTKAQSLEPHLVRLARTPPALDENGRVSCERNRAWCRPFSFDAEAALWGAPRARYVPDARSGRPMVETERYERLRRGEELASGWRIVRLRVWAHGLTIEVGGVASASCDAAVRSGVIVSVTCTPPGTVALASALWSRLSDRPPGGVPSALDNRGSSGYLASLSTIR